MYLVKTAILKCRISRNSYLANVRVTKVSKIARLRFNFVDNWEIRGIIKIETRAHSVSRSLSRGGKKIGVYNFYIGARERERETHTRRNEFMEGFFCPPLLSRLFAKQFLFSELGFPDNVYFVLKRTVGENYKRY